MFASFYFGFLFLDVSTAGLSFYQGTTLTLTTSICHGYGVYMFLCEEGMPSGANWILECETGLQGKTIL